MKKIQLFLVMLLVSCLTAAAQSLNVTGKVTHADDGSPVVGATIKVKGTSTVAISDGSGAYKITIPSGATKTLEFTYTGLKMVSVNVTQSGTYDVQMDVDQTILSEVTVPGYGTPKRAGTDIGSAVKVDGAKLANRPVANAFDALQGQVSGLQVYTSNGKPGEMSSMRLHGVGSLTAGTTPLYVVDGVPLDGRAVLAMNANDFESITVLKDASATSIYGSRAANGVIYISTKRGQIGKKPTISVSAQAGVATVADRSFYDNLMSTDQLFNFWESSGIKSKATIDGIKQNLIDNELTDANGNFWNTNWLDYWQPPVHNNQVDLSIQGGSQAMSYYISVGNSHEEGTQIGAYFDRLTIRSNVDAKINKWVKAGLNLNLSQDKRRLNPYYEDSFINGGSGSYWLLPYRSYMKKDGSQPDILPGTDNANAYYYMDKHSDIYTRYGLVGNAYLEIEPIKNFKIRSNVGLDGYIQLRDFLRKPSYAATVNNGQAIKQFYNGMNTTITNTMEYSFDVADVHNFTILGGYEGYERAYNAFHALTLGIKDDRLVQLGNGTQATYGVGSSLSGTRYSSFFGRMDYSYGDKYFFDASLRNDASSRFGENNRNAMFWSVGAMWKLSEESFIKDIDMLSDAKIKVSYGTQGNSSIDDYLALPLVGETTRYAQEVGWAIKTSGNPDLSWEHQKKLTVGLSAVLWSKLSVSVEYYNRLTEKALINVPIPTTTGFSELMKNVASLTNKGVDIDLGYRVLSHRDYYLNVSTSFSYNRQEITSLFDGRKDWINNATGVAYVVGQPVMIYFPIFAGIDTQTGAPTWYLPGEDISVTTKDPEKITNKYAKTELTQNTGLPLHAPIMGGFAIQGEWKGIGLSANFSYVLGKSLISNDRFYMENPGYFSTDNTSQRVLNHWKKPGDVADFPDWKTYMMQFDTNLIDNASFMRLKDITLSYRLPSSLMKKTGFIDNARIFATGRNLLTFKSKDFHGIDPEPNINLARGIAINNKQISFGVQLTF